MPGCGGGLIWSSLVLRSSAFQPPQLLKWYMHNLVLVLAWMRGSPDQKQVVNDLPYGCSRAQSEYPRHVMVCCQMIPQMRRHRSPVAGNQAISLALKPEQDAWVQRTTRWRQIITNGQHYHIRLPSAQLVTDRVCGIFVYKVANLAHATTASACDCRRALSSRRRRTTGGGLRCCSCQAASV